MKTFRSFALVSVLGGALAAGTALAQVQQAQEQPAQTEGPQRGGRGWHGPSGRGGMMGGRGSGLELRGLNLTDAQREQIRTLTERHRAETQAAHTRLRNALEAQRKAAEKTPVDEQVIRSATQELVDAQTELAIERAKLRADVFALLTPEQQEQAARLRAEREARRSQMRERRPQRAPQSQQQG